MSRLLGIWLLALCFCSVSAYAKKEEGLDRDQIRDVMEKSKSSVLDCYEQALERKPDLKGTISFFFIINADGTVGKSSIEKSELEDSRLETCIHTLVKKLQFPKPNGGAPVEVRYPFALRKSR